jgi:hypothetical protein
MVRFPFAMYGLRSGPADMPVSRTGNPARFLASWYCGAVMSIPGSSAGAVGLVWICPLAWV